MTITKWQYLFTGITICKNFYYLALDNYVTGSMIHTIPYKSYML